MRAFRRELAIGLIAAFALTTTLIAATTKPVPDAVLADGGRYYGPLQDGLLHGEGELRWRNGARYAGGFAHGLFDGTGELHAADGSVYRGEFRDGLRDGQGRLELRDGTVYEGSFAQGLYHGQGHLVWAAGEYEGEFVDGKRHGQGRYTDVTGAVWEGQYKVGELDGEGSFEFEDTTYTGGFRNGKFHGHGRYQVGDEFWEGEFVDDTLTGQGTYVSRSGEAYHGQFVDWSYEGEGQLRLASGDFYNGGFKHGFFHGEGTLTYAEPEGGISERSGTWDWGEFIDGETTGSTTGLERQLAMEKALYTQGRLLDEALAALQPQTPGRIDLYLVAVAGDGTQEVFRREVEYVGADFAERFGTAGHSVLLINSRNTVDTAPMATHTSLTRTLERVAAQMDKDEDILFLFLTSHGSRDHRFSLRQRGLQLAGLPAATLGELLEQTGIRHKVVVISACYSGGFIDHLRDDYSLVMTAARHDRSSFGCSDENDFTYFGRALFKEAIPQSASFEEAFSTAKGLIEEWEAGYDQPSLPQLEAAPAALEHLRRWREQLQQERS